MLVCTDCKKEMKVVKNGMGVRYSESHVYPGDMYSCPSCHKTVILTNSGPVHDPKKEIKTVQMDEN